MGRRVVFLFSGQGSQYYHMGTELFRDNQVFRTWMQRLDGMIYQMIGQSVLGHIYTDAKRKSDRFDRLIHTHPAIFMVEYALAQVFLNSRIEPDSVVGASLGEYVAAAVSGVIDLTEALECVVTQATLVEQQCQAGGMLAVLHSPQLYMQDPYLQQNSELAAVNYDSHFVLSGDLTQMGSVYGYLRDRNILVEQLPVGYGFHSCNIDGAAGMFREFMSKQLLSRPVLPLFSCTAGTAVQRVSPDHFWDVVRRPIQFRQTISRLEPDESDLYIDLGPTGTLATFLKQILAKESLSRIYPAMSPYASNATTLQAALTACSR